jgi:hypothetical protein
MKLEEIELLKLQVVNLKKQLLINQSPFYNKIVELQNEENGLMNKFLEMRETDKTKSYKIDIGTGEITEVENAITR